MVKNYLKIAFRNLVKNKVYSFLNIFGLAIGICCAGLIFLWAENELTYDNFHAKKENLYQIKVNANFGGNHFTMGSTPRPIAAALKAEIPGIANATRMSDREERLAFTANNNVFYALGRFTDPAIFDMFTFDFIEGNTKNAFSQLYSLVISETLAKKLFGNEKNIVGKSLKIGVDKNYVISGIVKDLPQNSTLNFEWLAPYEIIIKENEQKFGKADAEWGSYGPITYVELEKNANLSNINSSLKNYIPNKESTQKSETFLFPMAQWHLYNSFTNGKPTGSGDISQVKMLSAIAWIILLIACINFMNLATANSQKRAKETGVRKVLGTIKQKLIVQFMSEALFMSFLATLLAILIILLVLPAFNALMQKQLSLNLINSFHPFALLGIWLVSGILAGSYPSIYLSSFSPILVLKGLKMNLGSAAFIRKGLVVFQFVVSIVFIIGTAFVYRQIQYVESRNLGFNKSNLVEIDMQHDVTQSFSVIKNAFLQTGFIENVALSDHSTLKGGNLDEFKWQNKAEGDKTSMAYRNVSPEFVATSGMQILEGRDFKNETTDYNNVIINESFAKLMGNESAVGKIIQSPRRNENDAYSNMNVIGVIKDYVYDDVYGKPQPTILLCKPPENSNLVYIRLRQNENLGQAITQIGALLKKVNPNYPFEYKFVEDQFSKMFSAEILVRKVSSIFAILAVIISCLGLFGLATYTAERRIKEIGVRKVLGASVTNITALLSKDFLSLVIIASLIAFPIAYYLVSDWLKNFTYHINISWWIFALAGVSAMFIALLTVSYQAIKAALMNPVKSLKD